MSREDLLAEISGPVDAAAAAKAADALAASWDNLNGTLGLGMSNPSNADFERMGMELVQTGKVTMTLPNGQPEEITIERLHDSMKMLAGNVENAAVKDKLNEEAERLNDLRKSSTAMGKIKNAMADAAEENSGPLFGMSFGNLLGGLFSYLGKMLSWAFGGMEGEMPGFRESMATYAANNVKRDTYERLNELARTDPEVAAVLTSRGDDGRLVIDTLAEGMRDGTLKKGGVDVPEKPAPPARERKAGQIDDVLRDQISGANEYNARQLVAAALGAQENENVRQALAFNVGGIKVDMNYAPVQSFMKFVREKTSFSMNVDQMKSIQDAVGARVARVLDEKAEEYAALKPEERKAFMANEIRDELKQLSQKDDKLKGMPMDVADELAKAVAAGVTDPANEKDFRILPKAGAVMAPPSLPAQEPGKVQTLDQVFNNLANYVRENDPQLKKAIPELDDTKKQQLNRAQEIFVAAATQVMQDNPGLTGKDMTRKIEEETKKALQSEFGKLDGNVSIVLGKLNKYMESDYWQQQITAAAQGKAVAGPANGAEPPPPPAMTPQQQAEEFAEIARKGIAGKLAEAFDVQTGPGKFLTEVFQRRNPGKTPDAAALATAAMADPEISRALVEGGELVKLKEGAAPDSKEYALGDKEAFVRLRKSVDKALEAQVPDAVIRSALSEQLAIGMLEQQRPGFVPPAEASAGMRTLLNEEVDIMLKDALSSPRMEALKPALQARNGGQPINFDALREKIRPVLATMLVEDKDLPPAEFQKKLLDKLGPVMCEGKGEGANFHNDCGFTDPALITDLSAVISAQATEKMHGPGTGGLAGHEHNLVAHLISHQMNALVNTAEGRSMLNLPGAEGLRDAAGRERIAAAFAAGLQDLNNSEEAIKRTIAQKNAESPGTGDRWGFDHAMNVMGQKMENAGVSLSPTMKRAMIQTMLKETKGGIPGGGSWQDSWMNEAKLDMVKGLIRDKLNDYPGAEKALGLFGGVDKVAPVVMEPGFMEKSTEEKRARLHEALGVGVAGADTAAFVLAYGMDGKSLTSGAAAVEFVADKPLPYIEITPRQVAGSIRSALGFDR